MKKILLLALLLPNLLVSIFAQSVSVSEAAAFAEGFFQQKSGKKPQSIKQVHAAAMRGATPNYYIFEPSEGKGYVLVAANKASEPVLGYSLSGNFPTEQMPPGMKYLLKIYDEQLNYMKVNRIAGTPATQAKWENRNTPQAKNLSVAPLLATTWGQGWPYNLECPTNTMGDRAVTGCVATAMAQLMNYWNFPTQANPDINVCHTDSNPFDVNSDVMGSWCRPLGGGYNWSMMQDNYVVGGSNDIQRAEVANLMSDCGIAAKMDYGTLGSSALASDAAYAMDNWFGYSSCPIYIKSEYSDYDWVSIMKTNLNSGRPMYYGGDNRTDVASVDDEGHAWVVDGFEGDHFHMNWGWDGDENGNFLLSLLNPTVNTAEITLTNNQHMFVPIPEGLCTLQETLTGNQSNVYVDVAHRIIANATVYPWTSTAFNAGEEIVLTDGFTAHAGSDFHAYLLGCDGNFNAAESETHLQVPEVETAVFATANELKVAPNPFSGSTTVTYSLQEEQQVAMQLMDATGKLVATPMRPQIQSEGEYEFSLDGSNLPAGMYFLVTQIGKTRETKRLVLTR